MCWLSQILNAVTKCVFRDNGLYQHHRQFTKLLVMLLTCWFTLVSTQS
ncbi:hypothetical protein T4A_7910 [Trichinella pseudospiralis]|uniref:Uncharacterized protein n=1 Tax=Trichinella pseudospiralis TaxID=6337 RepID=A0A0V1DKG6_TRIPS|nr:hypothetical protein T4A_7910 [Trichinella pseudospiralis]